MDDIDEGSSQPDFVDKEIEQQFFSLNDYIKWIINQSKINLQSRHHQSRSTERHRKDSREFPWIDRGLEDQSDKSHDGAES